MRKQIFILLFVIPFLCNAQNIINNGTFDNSANWTIQSSSWSIGGGVASHDGVGGSWLKQTSVNMVTPLGDSTMYVIQFKINISDSTHRARIEILGEGHTPTYKGAELYYNGWHTVIIYTPNSGNTGGIEFYGSSLSDPFTMDSVSIFACPALTGDPYYVSPTGNDTNAGSITYPWRTWQRAVRSAEPGDTVYFRGGVYYKEVNEVWLVGADEDVGNDGERGNPISYLGYPADVNSITDTTYIIINGDTQTYRLGNYPIFDCRYQRTPYPDTAGIEAEPPTAQPQTKTGLACTADHIVFKDLIIRNIYQKRRYNQVTGFSMGYANNLRVENCLLYSCGGHGFYYDPWWSSDGKDSTIFINNDGMWCCDSFSINVGNYTQPSPAAGTWANAFMIITLDKPGNDTSSYVQFLNNRAWHNADEGVNLSSIGTVYAEGNWSFGNGYQLVHDVYNYETSGNGWKVNGGYHPDVDSNNTQIYFYNNLGAFNIGPGYTENNNGRPHKNRDVYNNTMYRNYFGYTIHDPGDEDYGIYKNRYRNNVAYNDRYGDLNVGAESRMYVNEYNSWNTPPGVTITDADFVVTDSVTAMAQLQSPRDSANNLPEITFLTLTPSSDLIDAGTDVGLDYIGSAPDLGYAEYSVGASFTADSTLVCEGQYVDFTDASTNSPTSWAWTFTGGTPASSTDQNPRIQYNTDGTYNVQLIATGAGGADTLLRENYITVRDTIQAAFSGSPLNLTEGQSTVFTDASTGNPTTWAWSLTGGTPDTSNVQNPNVTYSTAGTYQVALTTSNGCTEDTETKVGYITVTEAPEAPSQYNVTIKFR